MPGQFSLVPRDEERIQTAFRRSEPAAMPGQPPIIWHRPEGFQVSEAWGNTGIDWSSGVVVANAGHGRGEVSKRFSVRPPRICSRTTAFRATPAPFCWKSSPRFRRTRCAQNLPAHHGVGNRGVRYQILPHLGHEAWRTPQARHRLVPPRFPRTHARLTAGGRHSVAQGMDRQRRPGFVRIPFPDGWRSGDTSFESFERQLRDAGVEPANGAGVINVAGVINIAGVIMETRQAGSAAFSPPQYMQALAGRFRSIGSEVSGAWRAKASWPESPAYSPEPGSRMETWSGAWWCDSIEKGVLMFAPVRYGGATIKICPPLVISEPALRESLQAFGEAFGECCA